MERFSHLRVETLGGHQLAVGVRHRDHDVHGRGRLAVFALPESERGVVVVGWLAMARRRTTESADTDAHTQSSLADVQTSTRLCTLLVDGDALCGGSALDPAARLDEQVVGLLRPGERAAQLEGPLRRVDHRGAVGNDYSTRFDRA